MYVELCKNFKTRNTDTVKIDDNDCLLILFLELVSLTYCLYCVKNIFMILDFNNMKFLLLGSLSKKSRFSVKQKFRIHLLKNAICF